MMKKELKTMAAVCVAALLSMPVFAADAMPRSEWHAKVSECAQNAQTLRETIQQVSPAEQAALLAEVNEAIAKMPGSDEVKAAQFYAANKAAVGAASRESLKDVLAEVFATVPPEFLTDINERFAKELFSRSNSSITDDQFVALATNTMAVVNARCEKSENSGVRESFAALMFLRASGGSPENLAETLVATMPDAKNREQALNEWIKPAMGDGQEQTYDPMLGVAQAGEEPDHAVVTRLTGGNASMAALLADLGAESSDAKTPTANLGGGAAKAGIAGALMDGIGLNRVPRAYISSKDAVGGNSDGRYAGNGEGNPYYTHSRGDSAGYTPPSHPTPYQGQ